MGSSHPRPREEDQHRTPMDETRGLSLPGAYIRRARHAGSWYAADADVLPAQLQTFLQQAEASSSQKPLPESHSLRALIVPHAGYSYSGPTAAYSYRVLHQFLQRQPPPPHSREASSSPRPTGTTPLWTLVILHPAHHVHLPGCAVSGASCLQTPLGDLTVHDTLRQEILALPVSVREVDSHKAPRSREERVWQEKFSVMTRSMDEEEHSGEMQYPYLAHICSALAASHSSTGSSRATASTPNLGWSAELVQVLPIMCGSLSTAQEQAYGRALQSILDRPHVITLVSTDFCHWGRRFAYQPLPPTGSAIRIFEFIQQLDQRGMNLIQWQQPGAFVEYLKETRNTICGRHALAVWLHSLPNADSTDAREGAGPNRRAHQVEFLHYEQSSPVTRMEDSSVSYVAAMVTR